MTRSQQKDLMIRAISNLGYMENNDNDDEADAIGLLIAYFKIWKYTLPVPRYRESKYNRDL